MFISVLLSRRLVNVLINPLCFHFMKVQTKRYDVDWDVRLEGGPRMNEGRLEIRPPGGEWGTVCQATSNNICDLPENQDMCYRLGYVGTYSFGAAGEQYGKVNGPIWSMGVQCMNYMMTARQCWMRDWSFQQMSCDHSSDWALLCITETIRLTGGCTAREGRVEVSLGAAGWARLKHSCSGHISRAGADLVCKHLGYPMAIGTGNPCKINEPDNELPEVKTKNCFTASDTLLEFLRGTLLHCEQQVDEYGSGRDMDESSDNDWELACAFDDEVIATNVKLNGLFDIRLINGSSHLVGILELRRNESSWAPACFYDKSSEKVREIPENICHDLGHNCAYKWQFVEPKENQGLEHIFLEDTRGNVSWLGVDNRCFRHGGFNLYIECITETVRLTGGCTAREGMVEVSLGAAGWARLKHLCSVHISRAMADLVCKQLGYPMAMGTGNPCKINELDDELPSHDCYSSDYSTLLEYLGSTVLRCENPVDQYDYESKWNRDWETDSPSESVWELACAYDDEVIANNVNLNDLFDIRLVNGLSDLIGILELRHNESNWAPACFYDESSVRVTAQNVCNDLGHNCAYKWQLVQPKESQGLEYVFHEGTNGWLGVENRCLRHGGFNLHIECSIEITLNNVTVHILPDQTCQGRCGDLPTHKQCGCDFMCHIFKDCCFDIDICVFQTAPDFESHPFPNLVTLLHSSEYYECLSMDSQRGSYELVSICPDSWSNDTVRYQCESPPYTQPVLYLPLDIPFKNIMCAYCHGVEQFSKISPKEDEGTNATITVQSYYETMLVPLGSHGFNMTRPCVDDVNTCLNETHDLQQSCQGYKAQYSRYKNPHCALCNGVDFIYVCQLHLAIPELPIIYTEDTELETEVFISKDLLNGIHTELVLDNAISLVEKNDETNCLREQSVLEVTGLNSKHESENGLSGLDSLKCIVYAVAYSNLNLALHFSSSLRSLLNSEPQVERSGVTASIVSRTLSEIDDFAGTLDNVLRVKGEVTQTDWGFQCGLAKVSLIHECSKQPTNDNTSNTKNECIDTEEGASISMNISGELFVYVIDDDTLLSPVNITTTIAYDVVSNNVGKRKFIRFCGERNITLSCKTLTDFKSMYWYSTYIESPETNATLPNGETIVCFSKAQMDLFSITEEIVNLVCFSLSLAGLSATLITYSVFSVLRNAQGLAVMSLSFAIFIAQLSSIISQVVVNLSVRGLCTAVAVIAHYFWLSAFAWMAAISWDFMRTFSSMSSAKTTSLRKFRRLSLVAWCSPLLVIIPHLILHFCECTGLNFSYGSEVSCWIASREAIFIMFCAPVILCVCFNVVCFGWTVRCIRSSQRASSMVKKKTSSFKEAWIELAIYIKISSLMGFAWIIGFVAMATDVVILWYLFAIFSSLQGVFIFCSFAFTGRVRAMWLAKLRSRSREQDLPSPTGSNQRPSIDSRLKITETKM
ncbi:uncharacterized protein [Asterias amurensis]|uniref:uncharacterized protein n=1 Tax=Asterias amurensis TaxID=7602 RepID=UPI003AB24373